MTSPPETHIVENPIFKSVDRRLNIHTIVHVNKKESPVNNGKKAHRMIREQGQQNEGSSSITTYLPLSSTRPSTSSTHHPQQAQAFPLRLRASTFLSSFSISPGCLHNREKRSANSPFSLIMRRDTNRLPPTRSTHNSLVHSVRPLRLPSKSQATVPHVSMISG